MFRKLTNACFVEMFYHRCCTSAPHLNIWILNLIYLPSLTISSSLILHIFNSLSFSLSSRRCRSSLAWCLSMLPWEATRLFSSWNLVLTFLLEILLLFFPQREYAFIFSFKFPLISIHLIFEAVIALWTLERHVVAVHNFLVRPQRVLCFELLVTNLTKNLLQTWQEK